MKTIKLLNDLFQKRALSLETFQSKKYVSLIIYEATGIIVDTIQPLDRVIPSTTQSSKSSEFDTYFLVNNHYIINIEIQNYSISAKVLSEKSQFYLSKMMTSFTSKGKKFGELYEFIIIILYNGSLSIYDDFIVSNVFTSKKPSFYEGRLSCHVLQFSKLLWIYKKKQIKNMTKLEKVCFYMKYRDNKKFEKEIKAMVVKEDTVAYLDNLYEQFDRDALMDLAVSTARIHELEVEDRGFKKGRSQGKNEGLIKGRLGMCIELIHDGTLTIEQAAKKLNVTVEEMKKLINS
jgi:predicted transposase/invertase (TIGR01784 family)